MNRVITACLCLFVSSAALGQTDWQPSTSDFVAAYDSFPDPEAVILFESGYVFADAKGMELEYTVRIHVLKESGREYAELQLSYDRQEGSVRIKDARSFNLTDSGEIEVSEMDKDNVFKEKVTDDLMSLKVTIPDVRVGSILTYTYVRKIPSPYSYTWGFQSPIPALESSFQFANDQNLVYTSVYLGIMGDKLNYSQDAGYRMTYLPGYRSEPYIPNEHSYRPRIRFQLASYFSQSQGRYIEVIPDWPKFGESFLAIDYVSDPGKKKGKIEDLAHEICRGIEASNEEARARAIFRYVQAHTSWDHDYELLPDQAPFDLLETHAGNSADINALLLHLLKSEGLDAHPAAIGTREHGAMIPQFPIMSQFNTMLVYLRLGDKTYALDATDPHRPFDLPPIDVLNRVLLVLEKNNAHWEEIPINQPTDQSVTGLVKLDPEGRLTGKIKMIHTGYSAASGRRLMAEKDIDSYWESRMDEDFNVEGIKNYRVLGTTDPDSALTIEVELDIPDFGMVAGEFIYLQPVFLDKLTDNPFRDSLRIYPIDYSYPGTSNFRITYILPQGYLVDDFPQSSKLILPNEDMAFLYMADDQTISCSVMNQFTRSRTFYDPQENGMLRTMYDEIIKRHGQQLVLKKVTE